MAVRKRTGFKGVSSVKLTALKAQRDAANKRLESANARIKAANARTKVARTRTKVAKARSKAANTRIESTKKKVQKIKGKYKAPKKTQRGVIKARGGGPANTSLPRAVNAVNKGGLGGAVIGFFNPFPEAAAFQNPFTLGWRVATKGGKAVINTKTGRAHRTAHTETTLTKGEVEVFEGGQPGILGMPVGTGQKNKAGRKTYTTAMSGDISESMTPNVFLKEEGGEDFTKAGEWWGDYTKLTVAGKVEKGRGQPGLVTRKGVSGPSEMEKSQPGWYMKPDKEGKGEYKVSGPAGGYRVLAGKGKTKTWLGGSTRIEAGAQPGGKWAYEKWFKWLTPGEQVGVKKSFKGSEELYTSTRGGLGGKPTKTAAVTSKSLTTALNSIPVGILAKALKKLPEAVQKDVQKHGLRNMTFKNKEKLLGYAAEET